MRRHLAAAAATCAAALPSPAMPQSVVFSEPGRRLPHDAARTWDVDLADLDGDGTSDAFFADRDGRNRIYLNAGGARFTDASAQLPSETAFFADAALGDVDADGDRDVLLAVFGGESRLWTNDGAARFASSPQGLPGERLLAQAAALADLDGDGDLDALLGVTEAADNRCYSNRGDGVLASAPERIPGGTTGTLALALGDLDGDGDLDAFLGTVAGEPHRLWLNDGTGVLSDASERVPADRAHTQVVALADVDGDGDLDAFAGNGGRGALAAYADGLYLNDGAARFTDASTQLPRRGDFTSDAAFADVDGDGDADIVLGSADYEQVLLSNDGAGRFTDSVFARGLGPVYAVAAEDLDGDGDPDVVLGVEGDADALLVNAGGTLVDAGAPAPLGSAALAVSALALADVEQDGDLDLAVASGSELLARPAPTRLYRNDGDATFVADEAGISGPAELTTALVFADFDGDGLPELVAGNGSLLGLGTPNRLYANRGGRLTDASARLPAHDDPTATLAVADVDLDGDLDLFAGNGGAFTGARAPDRLYQNDGSGSFRDASEQLSSRAAGTSSAAFGDVDGDGDPDLGLGSRAGGALLANDGRGRFAAEPGALSEDAARGATGAVALADVDGDRDLDLVLAGAGPRARSHLLLNDGRGAFADATERVEGFPGSERSTGALLVVDLSGDSRPDLVLGTLGAPAERGADPSVERGRCRLFLGQEPLAFAESQGSFPAATAAITAFAAGDLDGDGSVDLVVGAWLAPLRVYLAHRRP